MQDGATRAQTRRGEKLRKFTGRCFLTPDTSGPSRMHTFDFYRRSESVARPGLFVRTRGSRVFMLIVGGRVEPGVENKAGIDSGACQNSTNLQRCSMNTQSW